MFDLKQMSKKELLEIEKSVCDELNERALVERQEAKKRLDSGVPFGPDELIFAAATRCRACSAGLAYPVGPCAIVLMSWVCSSVLLDLPEGRTGEHDKYPFAFWSIEAEGKLGQTTRPKL